MTFIFFFFFVVRKFHSATFKVRNRLDSVVLRRKVKFSIVFQKTAKNRTEISRYAVVFFFRLDDIFV